MTDVANRHWGLSLVRAPTAKDAADPLSASPPVTQAQSQPTLLGRASRVLGRSASPAEARPEPRPPDPARPDPAALQTPRPAPRPRAAATAAAAPAVVTVSAAPAAVTASAAGPAPVAVTAAAAASATPAVPSPAPVRPTATNGEATTQQRRLPSIPTTAPAPAVAPSAAPAADTNGTTDPSLARVARGIQDCARALSCLADRLDSLERRLDAGGARPAPQAERRLDAGGPHPRTRSTPADPESLEVMARALEGLSADRLQGLDQRLRRLETLPASVGRLQKDTARLAELATTRRLEAAAATRAEAPADLAPVYQELDSVAELVSTHHAAATQSLDRVRTLERAVLEMRRHLERNLAEHTRAATSEQALAGARIDTVEARLTVVESIVPPPG